MNIQQEIKKLREEVEGLLQGKDKGIASITGDKVYGNTRDSSEKNMSEIIQLMLKTME